MAGPLRVGIIGLGHLHPRTYMPHFEATSATTVVAASDPIESLREGFESDFGVRTYADWRKLLAAEALDLAYLFLPHDECPAAAVACAKRKIHVVVEKPVANTAARAERIVRACQQNRVLFSTPYLWRYHPVCREMKRIVDSGVLGRIVGCEGRCAAGGLHRYVEGHASWMLERKKSGGGPMVNLGVHWIDLFRWLLAGEISEVIAKNVHVNEKYDIEDNSFAICTFQNGAVLSLDVSYTVPDSYPHGRDLYLARVRPASAAPVRVAAGHAALHDVAPRAAVALAGYGTRLEDDLVTVTDRRTGRAFAYRVAVERREAGARHEAADSRGEHDAGDEHPEDRQRELLEDGIDLRERPRDLQRQVLLERHGQHAVAGAPGRDVGEERGRPSGGDVGRRLIDRKGIDLGHRPAQDAALAVHELHEHVELRAGDIGPRRRRADDHARRDRAHLGRAVRE